MDNMTAARSLCNAIASAFHPDTDALRLTLLNEGLEPGGEYAQKDPLVFRAAATLVRGFVETSRSEGGISVAVDPDAVKESLAYWCNVYGLDPEEELGDCLRTIDDVSDLW